MSGIADIRLLSFILDKILSYSDKHKERVNESIASINVAWMATYDYLRNHDGDYMPNNNLSNLWNEAARNTRLIDPILARQLQNKARFWIHPELPRQERIMLLTEITDELERLNKKFPV